MNRWDASAMTRIGGTTTTRFGRRRGRWIAAAAILLGGAWLGSEAWSNWHERSALRAFDDEDFDGARKHVDRALFIHPNRFSTNFLAARIDRAGGNYSEAERGLAKCKELSGTTPALQMEWTLLRCAKGEVDGLAPELLPAADRGHPEAVAIFEAVAGAYMRQTRYPEALLVLDKWVERVPDSPRALDWRGWVNNQLDHRGAAIDDYDRVLELRPGRSAVRLRLAQLLVESSRHPEAQPHLERLRAELPSDPDVAVGLAACLVVRSRIADAQRLLDEVLAAHPDHFAALLLRGKLERDDGHYADAEHSLNESLAIKPLDPEARYSLYLTFLAQPEKQKEAEAQRLRWERDRDLTMRLTRLLRTELALRPNDPDLAAEAGELLMRSGEDRRGLFWLNKALEIEPLHVPSHAALAAYYERMNDPTRAAPHRQAASGGSSK